MQSTNRYSESDSKNIWHPFTHQMQAKPPVHVTRAQGVYYYDDKGKSYIDAISSWWVNLHGHCHPYISEKVSAQLFTLEHSMFSDFTHAPAIELAERLLKHLPRGQEKIFYSDNGSTAVEVALKMTLQYWHNQDLPRTTFIAFEDAYHGDTFGSMSVGARNVFSRAFESLLFRVEHVPRPTPENFDSLLQRFEELIAGGDVAGFIFEPLVQGAAGMRMYDAGLLDQLIAWCKEKEVITIADEVMTGFGRTGRFFACDHLKHQPDIVCLSKGLTGGYLPLGVTSCAAFIHRAYLSADKTKTFFHGHSYTANPTACSAALASLDLMEEERTWEQIRRIVEAQTVFCNGLKEIPGVLDARVCGTILAVELRTDEGSHYLNNLSETISDFFLSRGVLLRPLGNIFYLLPPYVITEQELQHIYDVIREFLDEYSRNFVS